MHWATPPLPAPAWVDDGQFTVSLEPSVQSEPPADTRYLVKFDVVPEASERWHTVIGVEGRFAPGFRALMAASSHEVIFVEKIFATVGPSSLRPFTFGRLYDTVIGATTVGKYNTVPAYLDLSACLMSESVPAQFTTPSARSDLPCPEPPPA